MLKGRFNVMSPLFSSWSFPPSTSNTCSHIDSKLLVQDKKESWAQIQVHLLQRTNSPKLLAFWQANYMKLVTSTSICILFLRSCLFYLQFSVCFRMLLFLPYLWLLLSHRLFLKNAFGGWYDQRISSEIKVSFDIEFSTFRMEIKWLRLVTNI